MLVRKKFIRRQEVALMVVAIGMGAIAASAQAPAPTQSPEEKGLDIAREADRRNSGWQDAAFGVTMVLRDQKGRETIRRMRNRSLEMEGDGDKILIVIDEPRDVKGTALLTHSHKDRPDDQWLYLPALKRVKRIASNNKSGPFMGSEFSYEDLTSQELERFSYRYLRDETFGGEDCFVFERTPLEKNSGYTRQVVWMDKSEYRIHKVDFFDRSDTLLKTLSSTQHRQHLDKYWRAEFLEMTNHQTGKRTTLTQSEITFGQGLQERDFDKNSLARIR